MPPEKTFATSKESAAEVAEIVKHALELPAEERQSFLEERCRAKPALRAEIESLLEYEHGGTDFIETPAVDLAAETLVRGQTLCDGEIIGDYEIISLIDSGGMGEVYLAQDRQLHRKVALKLIRRGMDSDEIIHRFQREERFLACLNNPNIAQLYGGGVTRDGLPFFAMELVEGKRLDAYCRDRQLSILQLLELFRKICSAVAYAHQRLVVHRDLKPANIRVTDEKEPKLLDFGIAKLLKPESGVPDLTLTLPRAMTPEYASPEQVRGESVTTATDVYSLAVILYELLTGQKPYRLKTRTPEEISRAITEQEPIKPSAAIVKLDGISKSEIRNPKPLRGDLDNIILMALRKEPERRYQSVAQFSEDIRRYLEGRPVIARKDTFGYRTSKFLARNKIAVAAAVLVLAAIIAGAIVALRETRVARAERDRAKIEATKASSINEFLQTMLKAADPRVKGSDAKVTDVLDDAARRIDAELDGQPEVLAEAHYVIGTTYSTLFLLDAAEHHLRAALELNRRLHGEQHPATARSMTALAEALYAKNQFAESEALLRRALELQRKMPETERDLGKTLWNLGDMLRLRGNYQAAEPFLRESLATFRKTEGDDHEDVASALTSLAQLRDAQGDIDGAEAIYRQAVAIIRMLPERRRMGTGDPASALTNLGTILAVKHKYDKAEVLLNEAADYYRRIAGEKSPAIGNPLRFLAYLHLEKGELGKAEEEASRAVALQRALPAGHPDLSYSVYMLGFALTLEGKLTQGETYLRESLSMREGDLRNSNVALMAESVLGGCLTAQKRYSEAEPLSKHAYDNLNSHLGAQHPVTIASLRSLVTLYAAWNKPEELARYRDLLAENHKE